MAANANTRNRGGVNPHGWLQFPDNETSNESTTSSLTSDSNPSWQDVLDDRGNDTTGVLVVTAEDLRSDRQFYQRYSHLVDGFVNAVCRHQPKNALRALVAEADQRIALDSGGLVQESDLLDRLSYKHHARDGRSPLSYAVAKNMKQQVYNLLELGATIEKPVPSLGELEGLTPRHTALTIAATNPKRDGTEMVRILLSKGARPSELVAADVDEQELGREMRYWIKKSRRLQVPSPEALEHASKTPPMERMHEMDYAVVGQESAVSLIGDALAGRFGNPQGNRKPLVLLLLGPPGHGKTFFSSNTARSLVEEDNFLFVPCQSTRDDADLFGSRLGGSRTGEYSSDGQLTSWLRARQGKRCIVCLDEFEKMKFLASSLGWGQAKKIYQSLLELWNDGTLCDQSAMSGGFTRFNNVASPNSGGNKIDCSQSIWILTSNWGQNEIIDFSETRNDRVYQQIDQKDVAWIQKNLVEKILRPLCERNLKQIDADLEALARLIDTIVPFLPFTTHERKVVADICLKERLSLYREPCKITGPEEGRRSIGNLWLRSSRALEAHVASFYKPLRGASGMLACVQQVDGKFQRMCLRNQLGLTDDQNRRIRSDKSPRDGDSVAEPSFWVHYDKEVEAISITQSRPINDDDEEEREEDHEDRIGNGVNDSTEEEEDGKPAAKFFRSNDSQRIPAKSLEENSPGNASDIMDFPQDQESETDDAIISENQSVYRTTGQPSTNEVPINFKNDKNASPTPDPWICILCNKSVVKSRHKSAGVLVDPEGSWDM